MPRGPEARGGYTPGVRGTGLALYPSLDEHVQLRRSSGIAD